MNVMTKRNACLLPLLMLTPGVVGCLDILGFKDPVLDDCATAGCTGGGGGNTATGGGGTGGSATSTSGGGSGGDPEPFGCEPIGDPFEVLASSDTPPQADRIFLLANPNAIPPRVHIVHTYDDMGGHVEVRTLKNVGLLGPTASWDAPLSRDRKMEGDRRRPDQLP